MSVSGNLEEHAETVRAQESVNAKAAKVSKEGDVDEPLDNGRSFRKELPSDIERIAHATIGAAIEVHRELGPGLLESVYEEALVHELRTRGLRAERQVELDVVYKGTVIKGQRLDLVVEGLVVVELKSIVKLADLHGAQLLSYLRAARLPLGLLFNFNVIVLRDGMKRIFNERAIETFSPLSLPSRSSRPSRSKSSPC